MSRLPIKCLQCQTTIKQGYSPFVVAIKRVKTIKNEQSLLASLFADVRENKKNVSL